MEEYGRQFVAHKLTELASNAGETDVTSSERTTSVFDTAAYKQATGIADEQLTLQKAHLQKVKRALKAHCAAGKQFVTSGTLLAEALEKYAVLCTQMSSTGSRGATPESELSLVVFANALKELSLLLGSLMQSATNMTVFPLRNLLKVDVRNRNEAKRACEKACKQYEMQLDKIRKERLPDDAEREKRNLEIQICDFLGRSAELEVKRNVELLEHISEYAFAIRAYHQDAHERAGRGADQLATFKDGLQRRRQEFEKRRREFVELRDQLVALGGEEYANGTLQRGTLSRQAATSVPCSPAQQAMNASTSSGGKNEHRRTVPAVYGGSQVGLAGVGLSLSNSSEAPRASAPIVTVSRSDEPDAQLASRQNHEKKMQKSGYLLKRSEGKLKLWQKRRVEVRDGALWLFHADEQEEPVCVSLLTSQLKLVGPAFPSSPNVAESEPVSATASGSWKGVGSAGRFDVYSCAQNRRYHFQLPVDDVNELNDWITVIANVRKEALERSFVRASMGKQRLRSVTYSSATGSALLNSAAAAHSERALTKRLIELVRQTPGNSNCCDCDAPNPEWLSTNLGVLICLECCGVHRELGVHISRTQSLVIDDLSASQLLVAFAIGNRTFNSVFEATLDAISAKPRADSPIVPVRKEFIRAKYDRRAFVANDNDNQSLSLSLSTDDALLGADMRRVLGLFALNRNLFSGELNQLGESVLHFLVRNYPQPAEQSDAVPQSSLDALCVFEFAVQNTPPRTVHNVAPSSVSVNQPNSLLHVAVQENKPDCLRVLLRQRPDLLSSVNQSGSPKLIDSLFELAKRLDRAQCLELLEKAVSRTSQLDAFDCLPDGFWPLLVGKDSSIEHRVSVNRSKTWMLRDSPNASNASNNSSGVPMEASATMRVFKPRAAAQLQPGGKRGVGHRYSAGLLDLRDNERLRDCDIDDAVDHLDVILDVVSETLERSRAKCSNTDSDSLSASLSSSTRSSDHVSQLSASRPAAGQKVLTLYDCLADLDDELTFRAGETIVISERPRNVDRDEDDQWAYGYVEAAPTRRGLFPLNFVKPLEPETFF